MYARKLCQSDYIIQEIFLLLMAFSKEFQAEQVVAGRNAAWYMRVSRVSHARAVDIKIRRRYII